ncbi:hypothetical protein GCM10022419_055730 [Nonomuraea rosea]|uniref:Uncharacterized protein n=1 Tax=Nonomuraea rosea TaxID=638574 RepID=A0ABP6XKK7_9ACTN
MAVMRHAYAARHRLAYIADGEYLTDIDPAFPRRRHGADLTGSINTFVSSALIRLPMTASRTPSRRPWNLPVGPPKSWFPHSTCATLPLAPPYPWPTERLDHLS